MTKPMLSNLITGVAAALALTTGALALQSEPVEEQVSDSAEPADPPASSAYDQTPEPDLPEMPPVPLLPETPYPDCREAYQTGANYLERADLINACTVAIDSYYLNVLLPYRQAMIDYQTELTRLYTDIVAPNTAYRAASSNAFYDEMLRQHARANPDGAAMAQARVMETRYTGDRAYLEDRFCYNTGCGGHIDPTIRFASEVAEMQRLALAEMKESAKAADEADKKAKSGNRPSAKRDKAQAARPEDGVSCKRARKRGSALGSFLGGAVGSLGGMGKTGSALFAGFSGLVVGEIACQLDEKEQEEATKATVSVLAAEEVGATAEWISPTRQGVSGSSTVTAVNAEPNGKRCLSISDVAIIDGEETRVMKQMCRATGGSGYVLVA